MTYDETYNPWWFIMYKDLKSVENNIYWTRYHVLKSLGIGKSSHNKTLTQECWSCHDQKPYSSQGFWLFRECPFWKKRQLANELSVSKVNCDGNTLSPVRKKRVDDFTIFFKSAMYLLKSLIL